jgi:hypothetical protein
MACLATSLAQAQSPARADTVLLDREYRDSLETSRLVLFEDVVYQLEISRPSARPRLVPVRSGTYPPTALRVRDLGPLGGPVYEVHVDRDGEYDIGVGGVEAGMPVRLLLRTDRETTASRRLKRETPGWSIGLRAEVGRHSGYLTSATPDSPEGGLLYDACVLISDGTRFSLCLGGGYDERGGDGTRVAWIFAELHAVLFTLGTSERRPSNLGVLGRVAQGGAGSDVSRDPSFYGIGAFLQQWISRTPRGRGVSVLFSAQYGVIRNITIKGESTALVKLGLQWLP